MALVDSGLSNNDAVLTRVRSSLYLSADSKRHLELAISNMSANDKEALCGQLTRCLSSVHSAWRANACFVLGLLGDQARPAVPSIVKSIDGSFTRGKGVVAAAEALSRIDAIYAVPELVKALQTAPHPDSPSARSWTYTDADRVTCLEIIGPSAAPAAPHLAPHLHFHDATINALISIGAAAIPAVLNELKRTSQRRLQVMCRNSAVFFSAVGEDAGLPLLSSLEASTGAERTALAMVYSYLRLPPLPLRRHHALNAKSIPLLKRLLNDPKVQEFAKTALLTLETPPVSRVSASNFSAVVLDTVRCGWDISEEAKHDLAVIFDIAPNGAKRDLRTPLIASLRSKNSWEYANAIFVLGLIGHSAEIALDDIVNALKYTNSKQTLQAADALANIGAQAVVPTLIKALPAPPLPNHTVTNSLSKHEKSVLECLESLAEFLSTDASTFAGFLRHGETNSVLASIGVPAIPSIVEQIKRASGQHAMSSVCDNAAEIISSIGPAASKAFLETFDPNSPGAQEAISQVFTSLRPPALNMESVPMLCALLMEPTHKFSPKAKRALVELGAPAAVAVADYFSQYPGSAALHYSNPSAVAHEILKEYGHAAIPSLTKHIAGLNIEKQAKIAVYILNIDPAEPTAAEKLLTLMTDENESSRLIGLQAIEDVWITAARTSQFPERINEHFVKAVAKAWQDPSATVRHKASHVLGYVKNFREEIEQLLRRVTETQPTAQTQMTKPPQTESSTDTVELALPSMPSEEQLREVLQRDFATSLEIGWNDQPPKTVIGKIDFEARHLTTALNAHWMGQPKFLKKHILIEIQVNGYLFESDEASTSAKDCALYGHDVHSARGQVVYAYDGSRLSIITGANAKTNLASVFERESIHFDELPPSELAWFFCHVFLPKHRVGYSLSLHEVVESASPDAISNVTAPAVAGSATAGWTVHFWTLFHQGGCMPGLPELFEHRIDISPGYEISFDSPYDDIRN